MEKKTPHTRLHLVQALVAEGKVRATNTAMNGADELGLTFDGMCDAIKGLKMSDFFKSMTTYNDHTVWQDVYRPTLACGVVYLKLTVSNGVLIVSFKEK
ncbi:type II toxin-antitoxin system MqsR family toxin [Rouxiella badensis]|jgi:motility quorum-sensing regulator/GCU-specific mRNA interferase toxin|uniref:type II toxin-antitoxin system MqsR family toxin n=1 Tax=Rouxiella badensis TaxID=1646377 RepID=UPI0017882FE4|nr:type II toxin-antitoxin system MqsR family toxin [Rouxiella badensis]QOI58031.1 type II toxin-antitoxin system MqsR family toxin [Rouxiella badensis subsp. acadiensis]